MPVEKSTDIEKMNEDTKNLSGCLVIIIVAVAAMSGSYLFSSSKHIAILDDGEIYSATDKARAYFQGQSFWTNQLQQISEEINNEKSMIQYMEERAQESRNEDAKHDYCNDEETCGYGDSDDEYDDGYFCVTQRCKVSDPVIQEKIYQLIDAENEKERVKDLAKNRKEHLDEITRLNNLYSIAEKRSK